MSLVQATPLIGQHLLMDGKALKEATAISEDVGLRHVLMAGVFLCGALLSEVNAD